MAQGSLAKLPGVALWGQMGRLVRSSAFRRWAGTGGQAIPPKGGTTNGALPGACSMLKASRGLVRRRRQPREPRRHLEQPGQELPIGEPQQQPGPACLPSSTENGARPPNRTRSRPRCDACHAGANPQGPAGLVGSLARGSKAPPGRFRLRAARIAKVADEPDLQDWQSQRHPARNGGTEIRRRSPERA